MKFTVGDLKNDFNVEHEFKPFNCLNYNHRNYNLCTWFVKFKLETIRFVIDFYCMKAKSPHSISGNVFRMKPHTDHKWIRMRTVL